MARDAFLSASFWHGSIDRARAVLATHPELAGVALDIHVAATLGDDAAVRRFLAADPSLARSKSGPRDVEPLVYLCFSVFLQHDASRSDAFVRAATALLDAGADPNGGFHDETHRPNPEWESVLYGAAGVAHHAGLTRLLLERGANPNDEEVPYHGAEGHDNAALRELIASGKLTAESLDVMLVRKADWHDLEGVRLLCDAGADPHRMTRFGRTALHHALLRDNSLAIVDLLLDRGADPQLRTRDSGRSAVAIAARRGRGDVLDSLERRGVPLALDGVDRLIAACARGDGDECRGIAAAEPALVRALVADGGTLLAEFAGTNNAAGLALLLDLGVPIDARYAGDGYFVISAGSTALHVAAWRASHDAVELLLARDADPDARDARGHTPLMRAVSACVDSYWSSRRSPRSVRALLDAGASPAGVSIPTGYDAIDALLAGAARR
ncbi:MAG TPA: ankyrin repeat domain-containing protein [Gemmatimonadaceae bacterium]